MQSFIVCWWFRFLFTSCGLLTPVSMLKPLSQLKGQPSSRMLPPADMFGHDWVTDWLQWDREDRWSTCTRTGMLKASSPSYNILYPPSWSGPDWLVDVAMATGITRTLTEKWTSCIRVRWWGGATSVAVHQSRSRLIPAVTRDTYWAGQQSIPRQTHTLN